MLLNIDSGYSLIRDSELMLKRRVSLLRFLCILGQAGVLGELGELLTDQSVMQLSIVRPTTPMTGTGGGIGGGIL